MEKIRVILLEPNKIAKIVEIENSLEAKQKIVGGLIEPIYPFNDPICIISNEEGRIMGLEQNRGLYDAIGKLYQIIVGPALICGLSDTVFRSLTVEETEKYFKMFERPERFFRVNDTLIGIKY